MNRRTFIAGLGSAAAWPVVARGQQSAERRRVGVLMNGAPTEPERRLHLAAFLQGLREHGWVDGQNIHLDVRWNDGAAALARANAAQLVGLRPDVILAASTVNVVALQQLASSVPVVFVGVADPVAQGFVASVREPGGSFTGFSLFEISLGSKWLDLLKGAAPGVDRVALMFDPEAAPYYKYFVPAISTAAQAFRIRVVAMPIRATADIEPALSTFASEPNGGLMLFGDSFLALHYSAITETAKRNRLASVAPSHSFAKEGGLIEYGPSVGVEEHFRQAASYIDSILNGAKPAELPVQAPTKYRLMINMVTAKALGLTLPPSLLALADEVIE